MLADFNVFSKTKFFGSLDGLRAISILGVIWSHVWYTAGPAYFAQLERMPVLRMGAFGVDIFFCISGFLITTILIRERGANGKISLRNFYIRRALRIWPLYYAVLGLYIVLVLLTQRHNGRSAVFFHFLPSYLTYTYTWMPNWAASGAIFHFAWSLSIEEQFYAFWAPVIRVLRGAAPVAVMTLLVLVRLVTLSGQPRFLAAHNSLVWRIASGIAIPICLGSILAYALNSPAWFERLRPILSLRISAPIFLFSLAALLAPGGVLWSIAQWFCLPFLVGSCVIREDNGLRFVLAFRPLAYIGLVSYGMYMLNTLALDVLRPGLERMGVMHPLIRFPIATAATVLAAGVSYRFFETPFLGLKKRIAAKVEEVTVPERRDQKAVEDAPTVA